MAQQFTDEEMARKRADADLRERIPRIFSSDPTIREDAHKALKEAWNFDEPSFNMCELATMDPQAATLAAMRRDAAKEIITWLTKI
jgi:hypothetical protein